MKIHKRKDILTEGITYNRRKETNALCVVFHPNDATPRDIYVEQRSTYAMFDIGVHFLLYPDGTIYRGLPEKTHADIIYDHTEDGIYIMVVGVSSLDELSDAGREALHDLATELVTEWCITDSEIHIEER